MTSPNDLTVLINVARIDAALNERRKELGLLPGKIASARKRLEAVESAATAAAAHVDEMAKERRDLERALDDGAEKIKKLKVQLMEVKTNKEYTAMLHEIGHMEKDIDAKEERLLILMDELEAQGRDNDEAQERAAAQKATLGEELRGLESRQRELDAEVAKLESEKPRILVQLEGPLRKRYDRILAKLGDFAVTYVDGEICQGCFTRIPPQIAVEVRQNERLISCEACGRILVYDDSRTRST